MKKIAMILKQASLISVFLFAGCATTKYIPSHYFNEKHAMAVQVKNLPSPSHEQDNTSGGFLEAAIGAATKGERERELQKVFKDVDQEEVRASLEKNISERIKKYYQPKTDSDDLSVEVRIIRWGWILPTANFGIRIGSYQLEILGEVRVYDLKTAKKEIAHDIVVTQETINDRLNVEETKKAITKVTQEFAEITAEFLWRSDEQK